MSAVFDGFFLLFCYIFLQNLPVLVGVVSENVCFCFFLVRNNSNVSWSSVCSSILQICRTRDGWGPLARGNLTKYAISCQINRSSAGLHIDLDIRLSLLSAYRRLSYRTGIERPRRRQRVRGRGFPPRSDLGRESNSWGNQRISSSSSPFRSSSASSLSFVSSIC
ncbi:hypothetical protein VTN02DRAFT_6146 [Thermoascus thermophilus]